MIFAACSHADLNSENEIRFAQSVREPLMTPGGSGIGKGRVMICGFLSLVAGAAR
jgi:hypothetical protein